MTEVEEKVDWFYPNKVYIIQGGEGGGGGLRLLCTLRSTTTVTLPSVSHEMLIVELPPCGGYSSLLSESAAPPLGGDLGAAPSFRRLRLLL